MQRRAIITGGAGFIGSHLVDRLLDEGNWEVTVIDNFAANYPRALKEANISRHKGNPAFRLVEGDILDQHVLADAFQGSGPEVVVHLAARVGVRQSLLEPEDYHRVNVAGTLGLLEMARQHGVGHFVQASSSSVYGEHPGVPWKESITDLHPVSPYAVSKLAAESFVRVYARLHGMSGCVLRFFTVYGPRQRPDLAIHAFYRKISEGLPLRQFGDGSTRRDYTYVDDIVGGIRAAMERRVHHSSGPGSFEVFNLGNSRTVTLRELIETIEEEVGRQAVIEQFPAQAGDVPQTFANVDKAKEQLGFAPNTALRDGLHRFGQWYQESARMPGHPVVQ
jgi:UDP-glucuronate 4-epimerase